LVRRESNRTCRTQSVRFRTNAVLSVIENGFGHLVTVIAKAASISARHHSLPDTQHATERAGSVFSTALRVRGSLPGGASHPGWFDWCRPLEPPPADLPESRGKIFPIGLITIDSHRLWLPLADIGQLVASRSTYHIRPRRHTAHIVRQKLLRPLSGASFERRSAA